MRIQHNIMAMNAYRNYNGNTSALSKNLEKLSSGYRINRAGDDAAGLAISEKMRAQITGLDTAGKNVKDGISLVKTAEGAMQEVQDMLNRMVELATQSANGTYDNEVDRNNLQQEVDRLKEEIDRIADSANFNGIKLLDGSMTSDGTVAVDLGGLASGSDTVAATASKASTAGAVVGKADLAVGKNHTITIATDDNKSYNIELTYKDAKTLVDAKTGKEYKIATDDDAGVRAAFSKAISDATGGQFTATIDTAGKLTLESTEKGAKAPKVTAINSTKHDGTAIGTVGKVTVTAGESQKLKLEEAAITQITDPADAKDGIFTINGQKFVLADSDDTAGKIRDTLGKEVSVLVGADIGAVANQLSALTGLKIEKDANSNDALISVASGKELSLQIGDSSDKFNQMEVGIQDVHASALGIAGISIAHQDSAQAAVKTIKDAINKVSSVRGTLGATQNRLEHTQKNLSVMQENIQDAEATIRDTDVAAEMMKYTKNNILVQSAQAMLAQANQVPQGVLQLLQ